MIAKELNEELRLLFAQRAANQVIVSGESNVAVERSPSLDEEIRALIPPPPPSANESPTRKQRVHMSCTGTDNNEPVWLPRFPTDLDQVPNFFARPFTGKTPMHPRQGEWRYIDCESLRSPGSSIG